MLSKKEEKQFLESLFEFLRIQSISADPSYKAEVLKAVKFLRKELESSGFRNIQELYARGLSLKNANPVVYAEKVTDPKLPTVLIYGHYDVQPADPIELWQTAPFEPAIRKGRIYARGATDDKGQLYTHIAALKTLSREWGAIWPINVKIMIEGEEETNGVNLERLIKEQKNKFKADLCLVSDTGFVNKNTPAIETGLRGIVYFEMKVTTAKADLHSGLYGGAVLNPLTVITKIMTALGESRIGKTALRKLPLNAACSSFDIHGISGGYHGPGSKTVIPSQGSVKFSIRITPSQNPKEVEREVRKVIRYASPREAKIELKLLGSAEAFATSTKSPYLKIASKSMEKVFGKKPVFTKSGGSIPIIPTIARETSADIVMMGYGLPDDNLHSPNEKLDLKQFYRGIECNMDFLRRLGKDN